VGLACALHVDSPLRSYFTPTSNMTGKNVSCLAFIMCIPGINNLDTYR
jgi:hypothetical protein